MEANTVEILGPDEAKAALNELEEEVQKERPVRKVSKVPREPKATEQKKPRAKAPSRFAKKTHVKWTEEQETYLRAMYLGSTRSAKVLCGSINSKFSVNHSQQSVSEKVKSMGLPKQYAILQEATPAALLRRDSAELAEHLSKTFDRWRDRAEKAVERAFEALEQTSSPRELSSAASAIRALTAIHRQCAGLDDVPASSRGTTIFNFQFSRAEPDVKPAIDVKVEATPE